MPTPHWPLSRRGLLAGIAATATVSTGPARAIAQDVRPGEDSVTTLTDAPPEPMFDTHAHIISGDPAAYPPSEAGRARPIEAYRAEDLLADMTATGVTAACAVQRFHHYGNDNSYGLDSARAHPDRLLPVIMIDALAPDAPARLRDLARRQPIGGLRFANPTRQLLDTSWMMAPPVMALWEVAAELALPVAIIFFESQLAYNLPALGFVAEMFPTLPIVIDHLGVPCGPTGYLRFLNDGKPIHRPSPPDYAIPQALKDLRRLRNIHFKLTGINLEYLDHYQVDTAAFMRRFTDEFGSSRIMCGTDIGQTKGPYARIVTALRQSLAQLDDTERADILFNTADTLYGAKRARPSVAPKSDAATNI